MRGAGRLLPSARRPLRPDVSLAIVNIVLLLILFFLASGAIINASASLDIDMAETEGLQIERLPRPVLAVAQDGALLLDGEAVAPDGLSDALADATTLHVVIDRAAPAVQVLDLLAQPGLDRLDVRLVTIHRRAEP